MFNAQVEADAQQGFLTFEDRLCYLYPKHCPSLAQIIADAQTEADAHADTELDPYAEF